MKIMFVVPSYWPSQDGVANITGYLAEGLASRGHDIVILTSAGNGGLQKLPEQEKHAGVSIVRMRVQIHWPFVMKGRDAKSTPAEYLRLIRTYQPDILIVVCSQTWTLDWILPSLRNLDCVKVFYSHGYSLWKEKYSYGGYLKKRNVMGAWGEYKCKAYYDRLYKYLRLFDRAIYIAEDNNSAVYADRHGLTNGRVLMNAIDDRFYDDSMKRCYGNKECISYLFVANYNENKNQEMLIRAFGRAKIGRSRLVLVGFETNAYYEYLQEVIGQEVDGQPDKEVVFQVHISREAVIDLYRTCDVFVCSSMAETYSIVAHEAAAAGLPIISTDVGIYSRITGAYVVHDIGQMKSAMETLYEKPAERASRGNAAYEWVCGQNCRIQDKVDWLERDLQQLLA